MVVVCMYFAGWYCDLVGVVGSIIWLVRFDWFVWYASLVMMLFMWCLVVVGVKKDTHMT